MNRMMLAGAALAALGGAAAAAQTAAGPVTPITDKRAMVPEAKNLLLAEWTGPYGGVPPWDRVKPALFPEAFQYAIDEQRREILAIANNRAAPTFANTIEAMERAGERLGRVQTLFGVLTNNLATP